MLKHLWNHTILHLNDIVLTHLFLLGQSQWDAGFHLTLKPRFKSGHWLVFRPRLPLIQSHVFIQMRRKWYCCLLCIFKSSERARAKLGISNFAWEMIGSGGLDWFKVKQFGSSRMSSNYLTSSPELRGYMHSNKKDTISQILALITLVYCFKFLNPVFFKSLILWNWPI